MALFSGVRDWLQHALVSEEVFFLDSSPVFTGSKKGMLIPFFFFYVMIHKITSIFFLIIG